MALYELIDAMTMQPLRGYYASWHAASSVARRLNDRFGYVRYAINQLI